MTARPLEEFERAILHRLAPEASDTAMAGLRANGRCICGCYSVGFERESLAETLSGDAEASDADGVPILVSFLTDKTETVAGYLEIQRADSEPVTRIPEAAELNVLRTSHWGAA